MIYQSLSHWQTSYNIITAGGTSYFVISMFFRSFGYNTNGLRFLTTKSQEDKEDSPQNNAYVSCILEAIFVWNRKRNLLCSSKFASLCCRYIILTEEINPTEGNYKILWIICPSHCTILKMFTLSNKESVLIWTYLSLGN